MHSYIVRVYRSEKDKPQQMVGIVEEIGKEDKRAFTNIDDLWKILNASAGKPAGNAEKIKKRGGKHGA
jgi:DNA anti-recombination protein RmuC